MNDLADVDVLVAGGGVAGSAAAAALAQLGLSVQIIEPGPSHGRRLAGELIHPPGVAGLRELGLLEEIEASGMPVDGFAIFRDSEPEAAAAEVLPYSDGHDAKISGLVVEHRLLKERLLKKVESLPGVSVRMNARVIAMETTTGRDYTAVVRDDDGETRIRAKLVIAADGPLSQLRKLIGMSHETQRYSAMMGLEVPDRNLPHAGYGNIFLSPAGVSYAYAIGPGRARVMFEVLRDADSKESIRVQLGNFPEAFRRDIEAALHAGKPLAAPNFCIVPEASTQGNVALIGDARGCCHPLTASGITAAVKDALILRDALRETGLQIPAALKRYARLGNRLQLTRRTLAEELREAFLAQTPEAQLLSECIFTYWRSSPSGRRRSMALLSTLDSSILSLAIQYLTVVLHAVRLIPRWGRERSFLDWNRGVFRLLAKSFGFQRTVIGQWLRERYALSE